MSANTTQQKSPWVLAALLLSQVVLMSAYARHPDSEQSILRTWVLTVLTPPAKLVGICLAWTKDEVAKYVNLRDARAENIRLKEQIDQVSAQRDDAVERARQLDILRGQLALPTRASYRQLAANVVSRDTSVWFRRLVIDRGALDGVKRDMPVATATGVVGRVVSVGPDYAMVQVITDKHAGLGAMLQSSRANGEVRGLDNSRCELKNVSSTVDVELGEQVLTTGLDRIYPKGLVIGTVERVEIDPNAPWHRIIVAPAAPVDRVEQVLVLLVEQKDLKLDEPGK